MATFTIETDVQPPLVVVSMADWNALNETVAAAERRVAELEARLAEQAWRPVTEPPEKDDRYLVWWKGASWIDSPVLALYSKFSDVWLYDDSDEPYNEPPDYWQIITPPPAATE